MKTAVSKAKFKGKYNRNTNGACYELLKQYRLPQSHSNVSRETRGFRSDPNEQKGERQIVQPCLKKKRSRDKVTLPL